VIVLNDTNKVTTVPKDGRKDRPIAIENNLNVCLQLGVDSYIRKRLRRWGIDLDSQDKNIILSGAGSLNPDLAATIDLANASDTVSLRIAKMLLPSDWYDYLCDLRSPKGSYGTDTFRYSKLSSMGNGTTFAIESLIFAAITYGVAVEYYGHFPRKWIAIFGDDIVVPAAIANEVIYNLELCGFQVNTDKSFLSGHFKESCGADWFHGRNVRPVFLKEEPNTAKKLLNDRNRLFRYFSLYFPEVDFDDHFPFGKWFRTKPPEGPCSDTEFDSYWHTPNRGIWSNARYEYKSITTVPRAIYPKDFLFRKIMAQLRATPTVDRYSMYASPSMRKGSLFDVSSGKFSFRVSRRTCADWRTSYCSMPAPDLNLLGRAP
jgi:hypothetical protein